MKPPWLAHAHTAWQLLSYRSIEGSHESRMERFYAHQAEDYDTFRDRLLGGRRELITELVPLLPPNPTLVELGAGTGRNGEYFIEQGISWHELHLVDLSEALLAQARARMHRKNWHAVQIHHTDATTFIIPDSSKADLVLLAYSLTMIPNWFLAIDNALRLLRTGGYLAVVDFYVPRKFPEQGEPPQGLVSRLFWQSWFGCTDVHLSGDHIPYLTTHLQPIILRYERHSLPFVPWLRAPFYRFIGKKMNEGAITACTGHYCGGPSGST